MGKKILPPKTGLTDSFLKSIKPQEKRFEIADPKTYGLRIRVTPTGKINFVWYYRDTRTGKNKVLTLGTYGDITLKQARNALQAAKTKHESGELATAKNNPVTVAELAEEFYAKRIDPKLRRPEVVHQVLDKNVISVIGHRKLATLTVASLNHCIDLVVERGATNHAKKVLVYIKLLFKYGEGRGYLDRSPAYALDPVNFGITKNVRERWLRFDEIKLVWDALDSHGRTSLPVRIGAKILLLTGMRTGEMIKSEWKHIDFEKAEWFIPKENTKTLMQWTIPLTYEVIRLLEQLQGINEKYIFAGVNNKNPIDKNAISQFTCRLFYSGLLTIDYFVPHDFRRTIRTHLEQLGVQPHICEKCLNHSLGSINAVYNKNAYIDERRQALERWSQFVMMQVNENDNVTHIRSAG